MSNRTATMTKSQERKLKMYTDAFNAQYRIDLSGDVVGSYTSMNGDRHFFTIGRRGFECDMSYTPSVKES